MGCVWAGVTGLWLVALTPTRGKVALHVRASVLHLQNENHVSQPGSCLREVPPLRAERLLDYCWFSFLFNNQIDEEAEEGQ